MKRYLISFMLCCVVLAVACGSSKQNDGRSISEKIVRAVVADSLFVAQMVENSDTLLAPEVFGRDFAMTMVAVAESDTILSGVELNKRITWLKKSFEKKRGAKYFERFNVGMQSYIDSLSPERKMLLYVKISTPEQMGTALRIDGYRNPADSTEIAQKIKILRSIYNDVEYASFMKYYNRK